MREKRERRRLSLLVSGRYDAMTPDEFIRKAERLGLQVPADAMLRFRPQTPKTMQFILSTPQSRAYMQCAGEIDSLPRVLEEADVRRIVSRIRSWDRQWKDATTVDSVVGLTANGTELTRVGLDRPFVNLLSRHGVMIDDFLVSVRRGLMRSAFHGDFMTNIRVGLTNWDRECLRAHGFKLYPNMFDCYSSAFTGMPHFQGSCMGKKPFAFDFPVGQATYVSSNQPTFTARMPIPDAMLNSLRGRRMNDIVDGGLFGDSQTVVRAWRSGKSHVSMTMTPEIVPVTSIALPLAA